MKRTWPLSRLAAVSSIALAGMVCGCKKSDGAPSKGCPEGAESCPCYGNDTCDEPLSCVSHVCVDLPGAAQGGAGSEGAPDSSKAGRAARGGANTESDGGGPSRGGDSHGGAEEGAGSSGVGGGAGETASGGVGGSGRAGSGAGGIGGSGGPSGGSGGVGDGGAGETAGGGPELGSSGDAAGVSDGAGGSGGVILGGAGGEAIGCAGDAGRVAGGGTGAASGSGGATGGAAASASAGEAGNGGSMGGVGSGATPLDVEYGYVVAPPFRGYAWFSGTGDNNTITSRQPDTIATATQLCITGTVGATDDASGTMMVGFNLSQENVSPYGRETWTPEVPSGGGLVVVVDNSGGSALRVQIEGPGADTDATQRWCAPLTTFGESVVLPWDEFRACSPEGSPYAGQSLQDLAVVTTGGSSLDVEFAFCLSAIGVQE